MTKISHRQIDKSYEVYLALYQAVSGTEEWQNIYRQFSPDFFDLIVVDECHRGSAAEDSAWREVLAYFSSATQIGMTATPKETKDVSNIDYFGEPTYTYSLRQGIDDGFLAPFRVIRIDLDKDVLGWRPYHGQRDKNGNVIEDRIYNQRDMDRELVLELRTALVARKITEYLKSTDRHDKTIVFCEDIDHAERMRQALSIFSFIVRPQRQILLLGDRDAVFSAMPLDQDLDQVGDRPVIAEGRNSQSLFERGVDPKVEGGDLGGWHGQAGS